MKKIVVYDLPTRAFHFLFGFLFIFSFSIGKFVDDDSWLYAYHMLSGFLMAFLIVLRILWGFFGTKYARFKSFQLRPKKLVDYFSSIVSGKTKRELGHNPASSYAAIIMFIMPIESFFIFLVLILGFASYLLNSFNTQNGTLYLFGKTLQLSEQDNEHDLKYYNRYYEINEDD